MLGLCTVTPPLSKSCANQLGSGSSQIERSALASSGLSRLYYSLIYFPLVGYGKVF